MGIIRILLTILRALAMMAFLSIFLFIAPFISFYTMLGYQADANSSLINDNYRQVILIDFASNATIALPRDGSTPYLTSLPDQYDYKSVNAHDLGRVPPDWGFWNFVGFYSDAETWTRGKEAPMYAAYAEASTSSDALRSFLPSGSRLKFAPKIGMAWRTSQQPPPLLMGVCPAEKCNAPVNLHFKEGHELFTPTLTDGQAKAVAEMQYMMTDEYWLQEAHANGLNDADDPFVREMAKMNREDLLIQYTSNAKTSHWLVTCEGIYIFLIIFFIVSKLCRVLFGYGGNREEDY